MYDLLEVLKNRKEEIDKFINVMVILERKNDTKSKNEYEDITEFQEFFNCNEVSNDVSYQFMSNIMKSNVTLMLYNIIEFTVSGLIDEIYDAIKEEKLSYIEVNKDIQKIWRKSFLKVTLDPNANHNTFLVKNEEIIESILNKKTLELLSRNSLTGGNLDGIKIIETMKEHGIEFKPSSSNYRPENLKTIKIKRNDLAHGSVSFSEALRDKVIEDIKEDRDNIFSFLDDLVDAIASYIKNENYKSIVSPE